ncbi:MAG: FecR domain-containing protein [Marinoscillum sp.]
MNPETYSLEDYLTDQSFQKWAKGTASIAEHNFWNDFYENHPEKHELIRQAKVSVLSLSRTESQVDQATIELSWKTVEARIDESSKKPIQLRRWMAYAAMIVAVASALFFFKSEKVTYVRYSAGYGQTSKVNLSDGTLITLNANSSVKVAAQWEDGPREVWLESGEAFFEVSKTKDKQPFYVYSDGVQVKVLGTEFNVNRRSDDTRVMLREGKVQVSHVNVHTTLVPGEMAIVNPRSAHINVTSVDVSKYDSWLRNKIIFENTSLKEVSKIIEAHYGVTTYLDEALMNREISGELPNGNLELLLNAIEIIHDLNITYKGDRVTIHEKISQSN